MTDSILSLKGVGKYYQLGGLQPYQTLRDKLAGIFTGSSDRREKAKGFWALQDVSFELKEGEVLGIVGRNGAGKSTLLKLLSRITTPDKGRIEIRGRVGSLLEVGTGFHPELTGRENVFMNGILLGMKHREVERKFDEIVAFSGVEDFLDTPVKRYSSGMRVRLGFAVAAHLDPDILVVDEVLAVGDAEFQRKCLGRMNAVASQGRTVLYVSHQMDSIIGLCRRAIWLEKGQIRLDGSTDHVVKEYLGSASATGTVSNLKDAELRDGDGKIRFESLEISGDGTGAPTCGGKVLFKIRWRASEILRGVVVVRVAIRDQLDRMITILDNELSGNPFELNGLTGEAICEVPRMTLVPGVYFADVSIWCARTRQDRVLRALAFEIHPGGFFSSGAAMAAGYVCVDHSWCVSQNSGAA
jgi:lipopolysaccharide transport system ATP-binding protein